ncbi:MAG: ThiF family adenylyltransferase [Chitinophagales bacterium]|nr:ThiF family adenylyltransferase [Chitinophagales bacterium]
MKTFFSLSGSQHETLKNHLFPGDGKEAVAIALCGRSKFADNQGLVVHAIFPIPYEDCYHRTPDQVKWSTTLIKPFLEQAMNKNMSIAKIHCHPGGGRFFSDIDTISDKELFDSIYGWIGDDGPHASLIMLPDKTLFGRFITPDMTFTEIDRIKVSGDDIHIWDALSKNEEFGEFDIRNIQAFGEGTVRLFKKLRIGIIGCSGTGSPVAECLTRLGVGELFLVDPDRIEAKNLNRILTTKIHDVGQLKTDVLKREMEQYGSGTRIQSFPVNLYDNIDVIRLLSTCDILFGCMDSVDGRHLVNLIATFYLIPYIDIGVKLMANGKGGIDKICYSVHYLKPGQSLMARRVYSVEMLTAASLQRKNPEEFEGRLNDGYIHNAQVESPAVIHVNMSAAMKAVSELKARLIHYRYDENKDFNIQQWEEVDNYYLHKEDVTSNKLFTKYIGRGDLEPLLSLSELSQLVAHGKEDF